MWYFTSESYKKPTRSSRSPYEYIRKGVLWERVHVYCCQWTRAWSIIFFFCALALLVPVRRQFKHRPRKLIEGCVCVRGFMCADNPITGLPFFFEMKALREISGGAQNWDNDVTCLPSPTRRLIYGIRCRHISSCKPCLGQLANSWLAIRRRVIRYDSSLRLYELIWMPSPSTGLPSWIQRVTFFFWYDLGNA